MHLKKIPFLAMQCVYCLTFERERKMDGFIPQELLEEFNDRHSSLELEGTLC